MHEKHPPCYHRIAYALQGILAAIPAALAPPGSKAMAARAVAIAIPCNICPQCIDATLPPCTQGREHTWYKANNGKADYCKHCGITYARNIFVPHAAKPVNIGRELCPGNIHTGEHGPYAYWRPNGRGAMYRRCTGCDMVQVNHAGDIWVQCVIAQGDALGSIHVLDSVGNMPVNNGELMYRGTSVLPGSSMVDL